MHSVFRSVILNQRCRQCHGRDQDVPALPLTMSQEQRSKLVRALHTAPYERIVREEDDRFSAHVLLNVSRPERSPLLLGPLPKSAGGWGTCGHAFEGTSDGDYQGLLAEIRDRKRQYDRPPRFGMEGFKANKQYIREMKRFGILPENFDLSRDPIDVFETDQRYWQLFWYRPDNKSKWAYLD